jgi:peptide/nickel transport system permease protein
MTRYVLGRIGGGVVAIWAVATVVFVILRVTSDPASLLLPLEATQEDIARLKSSLGLDQPLPVQYARFIGGAATGNFGLSFRYQEPAMKLVLERLPATLELASLALLLALVISVPLGILSAVRRDSVFDYVASFLSFLGFAVPVFWLGTMLIILFSVQLRWLPTSGRGGPEQLVLPVLTLATWPLGQFTRLVRSEVLSVLGEDYVRTARAKGLTEWLVLTRHALKNASISLLTLAGIILGALLGGAIITETIFGWPGMGRLAVQSIQNRDFPVIEATVIFMAGIFVVLNLVVDLLYGALDPRVSLSR